MKDSSCRLCLFQGLPLLIKGEYCFTNKCCFNRIVHPVDFDFELKEAIRDRDGRKCRICDKSEEKNGYRLDVHHFDYDKMNKDEKNLISLCHSCHKKVNFNKKKWMRFFDNLRDGEGYF